MTGENGKIDNRDGDWLKCVEKRGKMQNFEKLTVILGTLNGRGGLGCSTLGKFVAHSIV